MRKRIKVWKVFVYLFLLAGSLVCLFPFYWNACLYI